MADEHRYCFENALACMEKDCPAPCRVILDNIADGVFTVDTDGTIMWFNRAAEKITGYTIDPEVGHLRRYTVAQARQMLQAHGFKTLKTWYVVHFSLGIMALLTVRGFRTLRQRDKTGWLTGKGNQCLIRSVFKLFEWLGETETFLLRGLPGAGFFIVAEKQTTGGQLS